jgi:hypothetical protein
MTHASMKTTPTTRGKPSKKVVTALALMGRDGLNQPCCKCSTAGYLTDNGHNELLVQPRAGSEHECPRGLMSPGGLPESNRGGDDATHCAHQDPRVGYVTHAGGRRC